MTRFNKIFDKSLREYLTTLGNNSVPVDIENLAKIHGVQSIEERNMKIEGYLGLDSKDQLIIRYKSGTKQERSRFTIAHEVGHIIISIILNEKIVKPVARGSIERNQCEERIANRIAAILLMPENIFLHDLRKLKIKWSHLNHLAKHYHVSRSALVRRLTELDSIFAINVIVDLSLKRKSSPSICKYSFSNNRKVLFMEPPEKEASGLIEKRKNAKDLIWKIDIDGVIQDVRCDCRFYKNLKGVDEAEIIGWKKM